MLIRIIQLHEFVKFIEAEKVRIRNDPNKDFDNLLYIDKGFKFCNYYGIFVGTEMVGFAASNKEDPGYLDKLYIARNHRRKGYAEALINKMGVTTVHVWRKNIPAVQFYKSLGFVEVPDTYHSTDVSANIVLLKRNKL